MQKKKIQNKMKRVLWFVKLEHKILRLEVAVLKFEYKSSSCMRASKLNYNIYFSLIVIKMANM